MTGCHPPKRTWRRCALLVFGSAIATAAGCFSPSYKSGDLQCAANGACPAGYYCAVGNRCYRTGDGPDMANGLPGTTDDGGGVDNDLGMPTPPDMAPIVVPPAATFLSCGGGGATAASGAMLNLSFPGIVVGGTSVATSGASISYGYFANASVQ